jgi:hypothetical protein
MVDMHVHYRYAAVHSSNGTPPCGKRLVILYPKATYHDIGGRSRFSICCRVLVSTWMR